MLTFLLTEQLLLAYVLLPELRDRFWTLLVFLLIIATTCLATSTIGLMCSSLSRRTSVAMVLTYLTLLVLFVLPVGLSWYLQGFADGRPRSRLAALTVTSPFSAALSVPMHTSRIEVLERASRCPSQASVLVPIAAEHPAAGLGDLPGHLPAALPGALGVTYLAFRWRWWRAGDWADRRARGSSSRPRLRPAPRRRTVRSAQRPVVEVPHPVGPADEAPLDGQAPDRALAPPAADEHLHL